MRGELDWKCQRQDCGELHIERSRIRVTRRVRLATQMDIHNVADLIRVCAARAPEKTALICEGRRTTLATLDRHASQVANGLLASDNRHGAVAVLDTNSDAFFELLFGAAKANRTLLPLNWRLTAPEVAFMLNDAGAEMLFVGAESFGCVEAIRDRCQTLQKVVTLSGVHDEWEWYEAWRARQSAVDPAVPVHESAAVLHMYTSGTTGTPKAVPTDQPQYSRGCADPVVRVRLRER